MAFDATVTCTEKTENRTPTLANGQQGMYTRTFTFPVLASAAGYGATDELALITLPANVQVIGCAMKSSVAQATGATFTFRIASLTAFSAALAPTTADVFFASDITEQYACTSGSDQAVNVTIGTNTCDAGTITVTLQLVPLGASTSVYSTYTG
jgi:hypothetical protein